MLLASLSESDIFDNDIPFELNLPLSVHRISCRKIDIASDRIGLEWMMEWTGILLLFSMYVNRIRIMRSDCDRLLFPSLYPQRSQLLSLSNLTIGQTTAMICSVCIKFLKRNVCSFAAWLQKGASQLSKHYLGFSVRLCSEKLMFDIWAFGQSAATLLSWFFSLYILWERSGRLCI